MQRRKFLSAAGSIGLISSPLVPKPGNAASAVTVNFLHAQRPDAYDKVIAAFEKQNPTIQVRQQIVPFDQLNAQIQARVGSQDTSIDIYGADEPRVPALATRKLLAELPAYQAGVSTRTFGNAPAAVSWQGKLFALPQWTSTQLLFYNKTLLDKAGMHAPSSDVAKRLTWSQTLEMATKAQKAGAKWGFSFEQVDRYYQLQPLVESSGAGPGLIGKGLLTPDVAGAKWVQAMKWYGDLYANGLAPRGISAEQLPSAFSNGQIAYFVGGPWNFAVFESNKDLEFGIAPHPYFEGGKAVTPTDSWAVGVSPYSKNPEAATKFAAFMTLNDTGALLSSEVNPLPPVNKIAFAQNIANQTSLGGTSTAPYSQIINYELANTAVSRPRTVGYVIFEGVMNRVFSDVRNGADAKERLIRAQAELKSSFRRIAS